MNERIKLLIEKLENGVASRFAKKIGVSTSVVANYLPESDRKGEPSLSVLRKILKEYPHLNIEWVVNGEGEMFKKPEKIYEDLSERTPLLLEEGKAPSTSIPLYDIDIDAGNVERLLDLNNGIPIVGWINLQDMPNSAGIVGVRAKGDSMGTFINGGDTMLIRRLESRTFIPPGHAYVIIGEELTVVKYIKNSDEENTWLLKSHNEKYEPFKVKISEVKHLFIVVRVLKELTY